MTNANPLELAMLNLVNQERAEAGLEELRLITLLNSAAEAHSSWMLDADVFSHQGENGSSPSDRMEAAGYDFQGNSLALENIGWQSARGAEGFEDDVAQVHAGLMASPGHRANILNPDAKDIGIGIEVGTFSGAAGDYEAVMVTQVFGTTEADLSAWIDPGTGMDNDDMVPEDDIVEDDMIAEEDTPDADGGMDEEVVCDTDDTDEDVAMDDTEDEVDPMDDGLEDDTSEDEDSTEENTSEEDETDDTEEEGETGDDEDSSDEADEADDTNDDDDVVAEDDSDPANDDTDEDASDDIVADEPTDIEQPGPGMAPPLPCDLAKFTVDLREAFEFRQEGDQLIWETSEDRLTEVFLRAFDEWSMGEVETIDDMGDDAGVEDLMLDQEVSEADLAWVNCDESPEDEWLFDNCA